ncbi:hypothetical protein SELMODRAFT_420356 [Selaginella moellendorffii]|uniref:Uncharacterized protein n=1 Tax=Selaginella moellendorffii TaxID=88036 RepID=D8SBR0_SELML|nr:uncharacterized protein LOC9656271 isoform X2 [Selaginella moellendorffii]EFJ18431.1 hypothetical protein SELMODRAFT_420356 [Selaginella moellendorffii]|eukprot:XP_002980780.1 uncharacterized protein LOC9656271 isoform X2 [Selaginella moellendorffii]
MESVCDDGEERLRDLCGPDYERLQRQGYSASRLWTADVCEVFALFPGNPDLACQIFALFNLAARSDTISELVAKKETRDLKLLQWIKERLEYVSCEWLRQCERLLMQKPIENTGPDRDRLWHESNMKVAMKSLRREYIGGAHKILYKELCKLRNECSKNQHYSCYTSIVQGSGTGKTRGVMQMSRLGVYICYCSTAAANSSACPPRTGELANQLSRTNSELEMALYFKAWLFVLHETVKGEKMSSVQWMDSQMDSSSIAEAVHKKWLELINSRAVEEISESPDARNENLLQRELENLKDVLPEEGEVQVLFVFDEGRGLLPNGESTFSMVQSPFYQMRRVARAFFTHKKYFAVVMDTMGSISNLQPRRHEDQSRKANILGRHEDQSRKANILGLRLLRPIHQVVNMDLVPRTTDLSPAQLFRYGRPLWSSRLDSNPNVWSLLDLAEAKLVGVLHGDFQGQAVDVCGSTGKVQMAESQALALLSASAGLEICPRSAQSQLLVASHMSILTFISLDRTRVHISQPVEPVVSEAAARILNRKSGEPLEVALGLFLNGCYDGYVDAGPRGEFIVKLILLQACWSLYKGDYYLRRIPLRDYIGRLLGWEEAQVDEACSGLDESAAVFFNSFMLVKQGQLTPEILAAAFMRGCAIMYKANNKVRGYDIVIPVWTSRGMTALLVSVKNSKKCGWLNKASTTALRPRLMQVSGIEIKVVTVLINVQEPKHKEPVPTKLWKENELHKSYSQDDDAYGQETEPVAHITVYGLERNFRFLGAEAKRLLAELSIAVLDTEVEAGKQSEEAKSWLHLLLPDTYKLPIPNVSDIKELGDPRQKRPIDATEKFADDLQQKRPKVA